MQYDENAEKYGYEGEMTPMKCDELKAHNLVDIQDYRGEVYLKKDVDEAIAELKEFAEDACIERDDNQTAIDELQAENAELKQKLEDVQASMYADVVDANMEIRKLKRALWLARAERSKSEKDYWGHIYNEDCGEFNYTILSRSLASDEWMRIWHNVELKCRAKAEEYK